MAVAIATPTRGRRRSRPTLADSPIRRAMLAGTDLAPDVYPAVQDRGCWRFAGGPSLEGKRIHGLRRVSGPYVVVNAQRVPVTIYRVGLTWRPR